MKEKQIDYQLVYEERKTVKLFIWLFYIFYIGFEFIWYLIIPRISHYEIVPFASDGLGYWQYILIFMLLPISIFLLKKQKTYAVKYFLVVGYLLIIFIDDFIRYYGTNNRFAEGGAVEVLFVFFAPVFINKKFFWTVVISIFSKYLLLGLVLLDLNAVIPIIFYLILSIISFIFVNRLSSYINSFSAVLNELHKKEKLAAIGQMATALGHEIRNPLSTLKGFTQLQKETYPNTNDYYPIMIQEIDRINTIVNDLLYLGKPKKMQFKKERFEDIVTYILSLTQNMAEQKEISINTIIENSLPELECDEKQLKQVLLNLIKNAIESMDNGNIEINVRKHRTEQLYISIQDEGCGIPEADIQNIGKAFYTTKPDGTGLGLLITNQIIQDHNGQLNIKSDMDNGTMVEIILPITQSK